MDIYNQEALSINISKRLRDIREDRGLSIRGLGRLSGLSANALSVIERGKSSPSVSTLYKIASALEIPITSFFQEDFSESDVVLTKANERNRIPFHRGLWEGLGGENFNGQIEPFMLTLEAGATSGRFPITHSGHELVFCLRGEIVYQIEDKEHALSAGDCLIFSANLEHNWFNPGDKVANALFVLVGFREGESPSMFHLASTESESDQ